MFCTVPVNVRCPGKPAPPGVMSGSEEVACRFHNLAAMKTVVLGTCLLFSVSAQAGAPSAPPDNWDLRWMVGAPTADAKTPPPETPKLRALGRSLFEQRCAGCHGQKGDGLGPHAARLPVRPTDFTLGVYKLRSTPTGSIPTDRDLFITLTRGVHGTPMLPWKSLSEEQRWALVYQLKSLSVRFREERPARPIAVPVPPKEERPLRERGAALYAKLLCARCHGEEGAGNGVAARAYEQTAGRQVRPRDFTRGRFIRGAEMEDSTSRCVPDSKGRRWPPTTPFETTRSGLSRRTFARWCASARCTSCPRPVPTPGPTTWTFTSSSRCDGRSCAARCRPRNICRHGVAAVDSRATSAWSLAC